MTNDSNANAPSSEISTPSMPSLLSPESQKLLAFLHEVSILFLTVPDNSLYSRLLHLLLDLFHSPRGAFAYISEADDLVCPTCEHSIWLPTPATETVLSIPHVEWHGIWGAALLARTTQICNSPVQSEPNQHALQRAIAVPILHSNDPIGVLVLADSPAPYTQADRASIETIALHLAPLLAARRAHDLTDARRRQAEETLLFSHHFLEIANKHSRIQPLIDDFVREIHTLTPFSAVGITLFPDSGTHDAYVSHRGYPPDYLQHPSALTSALQSCSCTYRVFQSQGEPIQIPSVQHYDHSSANGPCACHLAGFQSVGLIPIRRADQLLGLIHTASPRPKIATPSLLAALKQVAAQLSQAIFRVRLEEELLKHKDHLTDLVEERTRMLVQANLTLRDEIAERQHAEEQRLQATLELDTVFQALPDLYFRLSTSGNILDYRAGNVDDLYLPPSEFLGKKVTDIIPEPVESLFADALRKIRQRPTEIDLTYSLSLRGTLRTYEARLLPIPNDTLILVIRNITDRRAAEDALRASEASYRTLAANLPCLVYRTHLREDNRTEYFNDALQRITGYMPYELQTEPIGSYISLILPEDRAAAEAVLANALVTQTSFENEYRIRTKSGDTVHVLERGKPVYGSDGVPVSIDGILLDITELKRAQETMLQASRMQATATLAGGIAHDFNNLMVGVLGNSELLRAHLPATDMVHEMLGEISQAAQRAGNLAKQLLAYARGGKYAPTPTDLNVPIRETLSLQQRALPAQIVLFTDLARELPLIHADATQLSQIILNLTINAVEAIDGPGTITVRTEKVTLLEPLSFRDDTAPAGDYVQLTVQDTGCGMTPEHATHIFEPFFTTKFHGRGLGLAAVYGIVKNHNGYIYIRSTPQMGTRFTILFPACAAAASPQATLPLAIPRGTETILVIEDDPSVLSITSRLLTSQGYRVLTATNARDALLLVRRRARTIHLVLLDIDMPEMDGVSLFPLIKKTRPTLNVLFYSGFGVPPACQALLDAGAAAFLPKPYSSDTLFLTVRQILDKSATDESA